MGRPPADLDDYLDWQERLDSFKASGLTIDVFCLKEGVSKSTFNRWTKQLKDGIPDEMLAEKAAHHLSNEARDVDAGDVPELGNLVDLVGQQPIQ